MHRRSLLGGVMGLCLSAPPLAARSGVDETVLRNGHVDPDTRTFMWTNGGGDPLQLTPAQAFALPRVREVVPEGVGQALLRTIPARPNGGEPNFTVTDGHRENIMISARGRIEHNVLALPSRWRRGASRRGWYVYYTDPATGLQYRATFYVVCGNIGITCTSAPIICRCEPGDVCWS